ARPVREDVLWPPPPRRDQLRSGRERGAARVRGRGGAGGRRGEETGMEMSAEWGVRSAECHGRRRETNDLPQQRRIPHSEFRTQVFLSSATLPAAPSKMRAR